MVKFRNLNVKTFLKINRLFYFYGVNNTHMINLLSKES